MFILSKNKIIETNFFYLFVLCIFSFFINFYYSKLGSFPIDTFLHYDSAYRILKGELPIKDYWVVSPWEACSGQCSCALWVGARAHGHETWLFASRTRAGTWRWHQVHGLGCMLCDRCGLKGAYIKGCGGCAFARLRRSVSISLPFDEPRGPTAKQGTMHAFSN